MVIYGYARVSTVGQTLQTQRDLLAKAGAERIFAEKISGVITRRPELERLLRLLRPGDTVLITKLDRLARSQRDLLNTLHRIGEAGAKFKSLADAWADTTTPHGRLMLTVLGGLAEFERDLIKSRMADGRARAIANGKPMGRKPKLSAYQRAEAVRRAEAGEAVVGIARSYGVNHATISRLLARVFPPL